VIEGAVKAIFSGLGQTIDGAARLGNLNVASVWAFFNLVLIAYLFLKQKEEKRNNDMVQELRVRQVEADTLMSQAVESGFDKMSNELREMRHSLGQNK